MVLQTSALLTKSWGQKTLPKMCLEKWGEAHTMAWLRKKPSCWTLVYAECLLQHHSRASPGAELSQILHHLAWGSFLFSPFSVPGLLSRKEVATWRKKFLTWRRGEYLRPQSRWQGTPGDSRTERSRSGLRAQEHIRFLWGWLETCLQQR